MCKKHTISLSFAIRLDEKSAKTHIAVRSIKHFGNKTTTTKMLKQSKQRNMSTFFAIQPLVQKSNKRKYKFIKPIGKELRRVEFLKKQRWNIERDKKRMERIHIFCAYILLSLELRFNCSSHTMNSIFYNSYQFCLFNSKR